MNHRHDLCPFPDRCCDTLHRARPNITNRKYAAPARFEGPSVSIEFGAGQDKAPPVQSDARSGQPIRVWIRADKEK